MRRILLITMLVLLVQVNAEQEKITASVKATYNEVVKAIKGDLNITDINGTKNN